MGRACTPWCFNGAWLGNAIDFCVQIQGLSFHDAVRALLRT